MIALQDDSILAKVEQNEIDAPSARKRIGDTIIYVSQYMLGGRGALVMSDFGQARIGAEQHHGNAMPVAYRAPEVILGMPWGAAVDTWSAGLLVRCRPSANFHLDLNHLLGLGSSSKEESFRNLRQRVSRTQRCLPSCSHDGSHGSATP